MTLIASHFAGRYPQRPTRFQPENMVCSLFETQQGATIRLEDQATLDFWLEFRLAPGMVQSVQRSTHAQIYQLEHPADWPLNPFLPLRRGEGLTAELGLLYNHPDHRTQVLLLNLLAIGVEILSEAALLQVPSIRYASFAEIVADGWLVD